MLLPCHGILKMCLIDTDRTYQVMTCLQKPGSSWRVPTGNETPIYIRCRRILSLDSPQDISLPPSKCKSLELRSNCTSDCILDDAWDIKPTTISFVTPSFLPFVLCPYHHRQLRCHNITWIPVSCCFQNNWRCQNHWEIGMPKGKELIPPFLTASNIVCTDFACISNMFYACISDKCGYEVSC